MMKKHIKSIIAVMISGLFLFVACGKKEKLPSVQVGDMVFYYTGEPAISGEDDGSAEAILRETVVDYKGVDGDEKGLYFGMVRPGAEFTTLEGFDAMALEFQNNQGLAAFTFSDIKIDGTKARKAMVEYSGEMIVFVGFIYKDVSYLIYASAPIDSADLLDPFFKRIELL